MLKLAKPTTSSESLSIPNRAPLLSRLCIQIEFAPPVRINEKISYN